MTVPLIAPIVEGHGEVAAVPLLIRRVAHEVWNEPAVEVPTPHRVPVGRMLHSSELQRAVQTASYRTEGRRGGVLVMLDADEECALERRDVVAASVKVQPAEVVVAVPEYEAWLLAGFGIPEPETHRDAKRRLGVLREIHYSPAVHQVRFTAQIDIAKAVATSRSFRRFVSALGALLQDV